MAVDKAYFTRKMFMKAVVPAPMAAIGLALAEMGDTILIGHAIGMDGLAAIGFTSPLFLLATFFLFGLSMGGAIVYSNLMTTGNKEKAQEVFNFFFRLSAALGIIIAIGGFIFEDRLILLLGADPSDSIVYDMTRSYLFYILLGIPFEILMEVLCAYLRNDNGESISIVVQSGAGALNLILSVLLLFIFDWGISGCSFGFFLSNFLAMSVAIGYILLRKGGQLSFRGKAITWQEAIKPLRLGFATSSEYIFDAIFTLIAIHLLVEIEGNEGVAIFNVIENLSLLFIFLYEFIGKTSQPLFSTFFAENNITELHRVFKYALLYSLLIGFLSTLLVILYPQMLELLFGLDDIREVSKVYYAARVFCIGTILMGICLLLQNYLQSKEDESSAFLVVFMRRSGASIPLVYILAQFGFNAFWLVYPLSEIITLMALFIYKRLKSKKNGIEADRIYTATFTNTLEDLSEQVEAIKIFTTKWNADKHKLNTLRLVVEEVWGLLKESETNKEDDTIIQLTILAKKDGTFQLTMRNNGKKNIAQINEMGLIDGEIKLIELRATVLQLAKRRANQFFYRKHHDFNTLTIVI